MGCDLLVASHIVFRYSTSLTVFVLNYISTINRHPLCSRDLINLKLIADALQRNLYAAEGVHVLAIEEIDPCLLSAQSLPDIQLGFDAADHFVRELGGREAPAQVGGGLPGVDRFIDRLIDGP